MNASPTALNTPRAARYQPLVLAFAAVCAGVVVDRLCPLAVVPCWFTALGAWVVWLVARRRAPVWAMSLLLGVSLAALGAAWHHFQWNLYRDDELSRAATDAPQPAAVEVVTVNGPRRIPAPPPNPLQAMQPGPRTRWLVDIVAIRDGATWRPASGRATLIAEGDLSDVHTGDRLQVFAQLSAQEPSKNPGDLDFAEFARAERRLSLLHAESPECVRVVEPGSPFTFWRGLEEVRSRGDQMLWRNIGRERSGLAAALLLGAREELGADQIAAFVRTGTIHILAISGMHVAILASSLFFALRVGLLRRKLALWAVAVATIAYTVLTDSEPSAVRAMILVLLVCLALGLGRPAAAFNCWAAGGLFVLALNPTDLFRAGPQLSFLAVATMSWAAARWMADHEFDPLQRLIAQTRPWPVRATSALGRWLGRATLVSLAIWLVTAPLVMARFHLLSPVAVILSTLLVIPSSVALMAGFGVLILGWLPPLGWAFGRTCELSLFVTQWLVTEATRWPASYFWLPGPSEASLALFYGGLALWAASPALRARRREWLAALGLWVVISLAPGLYADHQRTKLECTFLSVGHGCCAVLQFPDGKNVLYDAGRLGWPVTGARSIAGYLWSQGIARLDAVVISHADIDHYNALPYLLEQFQVDAVYVSPRMFRDDVAPLRVLRAAIENSGAKLYEVSAGDEIPWHGANCLRVLHPPQQGVAGSDNANSIVLEVEHQGRRLLLPGDLESPGTSQLISQQQRDCDLLLAPHHGSTRSNSPAFFDWCTPEMVVISGGHEEHVAAVRRGYENRGALVLHTAEGAVQFSIDATEISVRQWPNGAWREVEGR